MGKKSANSNMHAAKRDKNDEFYTQLTDIERELKHYKRHFKNKVVFLNCDDPRESNFWKYFSSNFEFLGLKKLISTHYEENKRSYKLEIVRDVNGDGKINDLDTIKTPLKQNGDFRSDECIEILKEADIVVTNPPFSLFREYVTQLMEYKKKFVIVGNKNAITYKETFGFIKENKLWIGNSPMGTDMLFTVPKELAEKIRATKKEGSAYRIVDGVFMGRAQSCWFTNLNIKKRHEDITLFRTYKGNESDYPTYDNYNAINVDKVADIPADYMGAMGVPITFMNKYNPDQFEILGLLASAGYDREIVGIPFIGEGDARPLIDGKVKYARVLIKRK